MSSLALFKLFKKANISLSEKVLITLNNLTTNLDKSNKNSIVFYNITDVKNVELFKQRLEKSKAPVIILNCIMQAKEKVAALSNKRIYMLDSDKYLKLQDDLVEYFYPITNQIKICGITGTNGKTTVVHLCNGLSRILGKKTLSIGTLGVIDQDGKILEELYSTTPSRVDLRRIIYTYQEKYEALFLEVSSHGLSQGRMKGLFFFAAGWTSFSQDHLDYHGNMQEYFNAKSEINNHIIAGNPIIIASAEKELIKRLKEKSLIKVAALCDRSKFQNANNVFNIAYNKSNLELSLEIVDSLWTIKENINLESLIPPPGRFSLLTNKNEKVIVDYAHTPDALENICSAVRMEYKEYFLIIVFGCGGDRDPLKRSLMGKAAEIYSDLVIVTSDNPRLEDPNVIINEIIKGMNKEYVIEADRKKAIKMAMCHKSSRPKIVIIAGKGHEEYQDINGEKIAYSDFTVINEIWDIE
jgi:UDP-N-acetylmuramoyl-L-alanyl-D-glutamate--2,6-diaminopimelate ligase